MLPRCCCSRVWGEEGRWVIRRGLLVICKLIILSLHRMEMMTMRRYMREKKSVRRIMMMDMLMKINSISSRR
jgi:hypothetical protein